jgi:hypothetical protein
MAEIDWKAVWQREKRLFLRVLLRDALIYAAVLMVGFGIVGSLFLADAIWRGWQ